MFGNNPAKIDDKGRLKVPTEFRTEIESTWGTALFVTSDSGSNIGDIGESVVIYPMPVWLEIQQKVAAMASTTPARKKFSLLTNYYGKATEIDGQGRVTIHPLLRDVAQMTGDVLVFGEPNRLVIWNKERFERDKIAHLKLTDEDRKALADAGI